MSSSPSSSSMSTQASHCSDNHLFIAILLKQAGGIFGKLHVDGKILNGDFFDADYYEVVDSEEFTELFQESKALVNYTDRFVLKDPSDKMTEIRALDRCMTDTDPYPREIKYSIRLSICKPAIFLFCEVEYMVEYMSVLRLRSRNSVGASSSQSCANSMACCGEKKFTCFGSFCQIGREENEIRILEAWNNENLKASHKGKIC